MGFALSCTRSSKSNTPSIDKDSSVGQVARGGDREDDVDAIWWYKVNPYQPSTTPPGNLRVGAFPPSREDDAIPATDPIIPKGCVVAGLQKLPSEILLNVLSYLPPSSRVSLNYVWGPRILAILIW